jgi:hypothetical protein
MPNRLEAFFSQGIIRDSSSIELDHVQCPQAAHHQRGGKPDTAQAGHDLPIADLGLLVHFHLRQKPSCEKGGGVLCHSDLIASIAKPSSTRCTAVAESDLGHGHQAVAHGALSP